MSFGLLPCPGESFTVKVLVNPVDKVNDLLAQYPFFIIIQGVKKRGIGGGWCFGGVLFTISGRFILPGIANRLVFLQHFRFSAGFGQLSAQFLQMGTESKIFLFKALVFFLEVIYTCLYPGKQITKLLVIWLVVVRHSLCSV